MGKMEMETRVQKKKIKKNQAVIIQFDVELYINDVLNDPNLKVER